MNFHSHLRPHLTQHEKTESETQDPTETFTTNKQQYDSSRMYRRYVESPSPIKNKIKQGGSACAY